MKSFLELIREQEKTHNPVVMSFGRMNPPTTGHLKLLDKVRSTAEHYNAPHTVVVSHSQDAKKNPLSTKQKIKHLKRYSPGTHFEASSKEHPSIFHHASKLHDAGHDHLIVVAGSDRVKEFQDSLDKYNGVKGKHGYYKFKKITVVSAGHRDPDAEGAEGMSGTKMREHAKNNDFSSFRQGVPPHVSDEHAKELMNDTRKGMGLHEEANHGAFKAIFVTGGPNSGKDIIIRESIAEENAIEINTHMAFEFLADKQKLTQKSFDVRLESIRNRKPLIINGPADDWENILYIKEELEELGYVTMMVFVDTTNEISQKRNNKLSRKIQESIRYDRWLISQKNKQLFESVFKNFVHFDNSRPLHLIEEDITESYQIIDEFLNSNYQTESALLWLENHGWLNTSIIIKQMFNEEDGKKPVNIFSQKNKIIQEQTKPKLKQTGPKADTSITPDNRNNEPNVGDVRYDAGKRTKTYTFGSGFGVYAEGKNPTLTKRPEQKEPNFQKDNDKNRRLKKGDTSLRVQRPIKADGVGSEYDTRAGGQGAAAGAGLGSQTYSEDQEYSNAQPSSSAMPGSSALQPNPLSNEYNVKKYFKKIKIKEYVGFQNDTESGVGGVLGGSSNVEKMDSYKDVNRNIQNDYGIKIKKKKKQEK